MSAEMSAEMSAQKRWRGSTTATVLILVAAAAGVVGLAMLLLGDSGPLPTTFQAPGMHLNVSTASLALVVMLVGFGVALATLAIRVAYAKGQAAEQRRALIALVE